MSNIFYCSAELRWFLRKQEDQWDQIVKWFRLQDKLLLRKEGCYDPKTVTEPFVKHEIERADEYLLFPDCDTVGVKQRQGKLEVKALVVGPRPFSLPRVGVAGHMDQWIKWSFASQLQKQLEVELAQAGPWRKVVKDRYLQKYSFDTGCIVAVPPDNRPDTGCNIELTKISVKAKVWDWFTFGFEAYGPSGRINSILDEAVEHFFSSYGHAPVQLDRRDSISYPAWLAWALMNKSKIG
jgi:hypothetical protein